ncbi:MAG: alcohol dehydrogenase catalytic domain-containing protein [Candidatus Tectomicrobia bacterium]|uniref:Alcohol dehydrogenase catalytic domain-containing protein n=1 Tax=Tectimicrobiota bacterium TaxID=2528274 RepID=A0A933GMF3_UNCTE|nr:alcohol dehydrogenase catalytic domain-containing protein [Candidatus Tectomicrobia bacterium]
MKALIFDGKLTLNSRYPLPKRELDEALVRVKLSGICRTDLEILKGYMDFKGVLGHEFVGEVVESPRQELMGTRVVGEINCPCFKCPTCLSGRVKHCPSRSVLGISSRDGAFAQYLSLPIGNLHIVPTEITDEEAVFVEPLAACYEILEQVHFQPGQSIAVMGDGKLGLLVCQVLRLTGCQVKLIGKHTENLSLALSWGIDTVIREQIMTGEEKFDFVVDCTGKAEGFRESLNLTKPGGTLILKSTAFQSEPINLAPLVINEIQVVGSRCGPFAPALMALKEKLIHVRALINSVFTLDEGLEAFQKASKPGIMKVLIQTT